MNAQDTRGVLADPTVRAFAPLGAALVGTPLVLGIVIAACGRLAGASLSWASLAGAAGALACAAWLARSIVVARARARHTSASEPLVVRMTRAEEPTLFAAFDGVCAQMGMPPLASIELTPEANASASHRDGADVVTLGMPLLALNLRWELLATLAHELGHVHAGDTRRAHAWWIGLAADVALEAPSSVLRATFGRALTRAAPLFFAARQQEERRADAWTAYVVGRGAVARSLRVDAQIEEIWDVLMHQAAMLAEDGTRVDNLFALARAAWNEADRKQLLAYVHRRLDAASTDEATTHPTLQDRAAHAERMVANLTHEPPTVDETARMWLGDPESVERVWTAALFAHFARRPASELRLIADRNALTRSHTLHVAEGRARLAQRARQVALEDLPMSARLQIVFESCASSRPRTAAWKVPVRVGAVERMADVQPFTLAPVDAYVIVRAIIAEAVVAGALEGAERFGLPGTVRVGGREWLSRQLTSELVASRGPWLELLEQLARWDRLEKTDPRAHVLLADWRARTPSPTRRT